MISVTAADAGKVCLPWMQQQHRPPNEMRNAANFNSMAMHFYSDAK